MSLYCSRPTSIISLSSYYKCRNFVALQAVTKLGADINIKCFGTPTLHLVLGIHALPDGQDFGSESFAYLLHYADLGAKVKKK